MKIAILGFGVEGQSAYRYWSKQDADITVHDQNPDIELPTNTKSVLGQSAYDDLDQYNYDLIVRSPGSRVDPSLTTKVISSTNEFFEKCPAPIIGVTGTKGKGTTSSLIHEILIAAGKSSHLVGNIGNAALDELPSIKADDFVVFEMSSFQLFDIHKSPHVAVHLMFEPDHQDWHTDLDEYAQAKANIFKYQTQDDIAVYYYQSETVKKSVEQSKASVKIPYGYNMETKEGVRVEDQHVMYFDQAIIQTKLINLVGKHMQDNVCAAVAATVPVLFGKAPKKIDPKPFTTAISNFQGLPHRVQPVATINGVEYIDDSYSSTPSAAMAGIRAFSQPKVVILGGFDKQADFAELANVVASNDVRHVVLVGATGPKIAKALDKVKYADYSMGAKDMKEIVTQAQSKAKVGDVVLLSPGCASFDMFKNFTDRGEQFIEAVKGL